MRDHVILDAFVNFVGYDPAIDEISLASIGPEADDARCPGARKSGNLE